MTKEPKIKRAVFELLFPTKCVSCNKIVRSLPLCKECFDELLVTAERNCNICQKSPNDCTCIKLSNIKHHFIPFWYSGNALTKAIFRMKTSKIRENTDFFASIIVNEIKLRFGKLDVREQFDVVTFVPRSEGQKRLFGVDQSEYLASRIAFMLDLKCEKLLMHLGGSQQKRLRQKGREENVKESYIPLKKASTHKRVLLVDDVITTGMTVNRCAEMLKMAGARSVSVAAIAKTFFV